MELHRSLSFSSLADLLSRRRMLLGAGVLAASAGGAPLAHAQTTPSHLKFANPDGIAKPAGYTHVVEMTGPGRTIYIAGQLGYDSAGKRAGEIGDFTAQATQCFENLKIALASVGAGFEHVVNLNNYLTNISHLPQFRDVRNKYITGAPPASTTIEISKLARPEALLEVEAIAVVAVR
ncbi:MAG: RidA family protein [Alphaproteobacteria bacterium]|nr:RidA family protein [Alphaproteobacteria bacterium]